MNPFEEVSPSDFERLVARTLASFGWEVSLTPTARDGGVDIIGVTRDPSGLETTWAIECKHNRRFKVGVEVLRALVAVREMLGFDKCVLVTSGEVTPEVSGFAENVRGIHVIDGTGLTTWLQSAQPPHATAPVEEPRGFESCFLSHSALDAEFSGLLTSKLRRAGVRVWYAPEELNAGQKIVDQIDAALDTFDRLLVVLSKASISSRWVTTEIRKAFRRQKLEKRQMLFPISLIPFEELRKWEWIDPDTGEDLALELRSYFIPDFSGWADAPTFDAQLQRLLTALRKRSKP